LIGSCNELHAGHAAGGFARIEGMPAINKSAAEAHYVQRGGLLHLDGTKDGEKGTVSLIEVVRNPYVALPLALKMHESIKSLYENRWFFTHQRLQINSGNSATGKLGDRTLEGIALKQPLAHFVYFNVGGNDGLPFGFSISYAVAQHDFKRFPIGKGDSMGRAPWIRHRRAPLW
jgi:hypothetical protein